MRLSFPFLPILLFAALPAFSQDAAVIAESKKANAYFDQCFDEGVDRSPEAQSYLGIKKDYDKWDDASEAAQAENLAITVRQLAVLQRTIRPELLDAPTKVSYLLFTEQAESEIEGWRWRYHNYPVNQMFGVQADWPAFLINIHGITDRKDADAYLARLRGIPTLVDQTLIGLKIRQDLGIIPPKLVFAKVLDDCRNLLTGKPFDQSETDSTLLEDFKNKISEISSIAPASREKLTADAVKALQESFRPAYEKLIAFLTEQEKLATDNQGVWHLPDGDEFYRYRLRQITTTGLSPEQIHQLGLEQVARIRGEMAAIQQKVGFQGTLEEFFKHLRDDPQFYYPDTAEGKAAYLARATEIIDTMRGRLDELFLTKPKAPIIVKAVEPFREKSAGGAFYQDPAPDGSRPGIYYANLSSMRDMPKYQMEALAYHEGIPGHHMQLALAQEMTSLPKFRRYGGSYTAYVEGWGLYCEYIPKQMGFYADPYSDFGRLSMEMMRACRLVVDTGIHQLKWTPQQAIDYMTSNSPMSVGDATREVNRYFVMPGQATAYKVGMLKLLELRQKAETTLGDRFDVREFHDVILKNGAVPLNVLEQLINEYIAAKQGPAQLK